MKKDLGVIFGLFAIVIILVAFGGSFTSISFLNPENEATSQARKKGVVDIILRELKIEAEVANSLTLRKKGLAGRDSLEINKGVLFVFEKSSNYAFWMKDVKFSIDIIWIDESKKIVYISESAYPEYGKKDFELTRYRTPSPAKYVLEINAGLSKLHGLQSGDLVNFSL